MSARWIYDDDNVAFADGSGTYAAGWYAAAPSTIGCGQPPDDGPFEDRAAAVTRAAELERAETYEDDEA